MRIEEKPSGVPFSSTTFPRIVVANRSVENPDRKTHSSTKRSLIVPILFFNRVCYLLNIMASDLPEKPESPAVIPPMSADNEINENGASFFSTNNEILCARI